MSAQQPLHGYDHLAPELHVRLLSTIVARIPICIVTRSRIGRCRNVLVLSHDDMALHRLLLLTAQRCAVVSL